MNDCPVVSGNSLRYCLFEIENFEKYFSLSLSSSRYMEFFPKPTEIYAKIFEVSSTYFESSAATFRANALLKIAKIIIILPDPVQHTYIHYMVSYRIHFCLSSKLICFIAEIIVQQKKNHCV